MYMKYLRVPESLYHSINVITINNNYVWGCQEILHRGEKKLVLLLKGSILNLSRQVHLYILFLSQQLFIFKNVSCNILRWGVSCFGSSISQTEKWQKLISSFKYILVLLFNQ